MPVGIFAIKTAYTAPKHRAGAIYIFSEVKFSNLIEKESEGSDDMYVSMHRLKLPSPLLTYSMVQSPS
jgi:hypothetical protein